MRIERESEQKVAKSTKMKTMKLVGLIWAGLILAFAALVGTRGAESPKSQIPVTYQWSRDFLGNSTASGGRSNLVAETRVSVNVRDYGAVGDGTTDDTAAVLAAYLKLIVSGGELVFPAGKFKFNLVITNQNISIRGSSHFIDYTGASTNCFIPADVTKPVIQIGNDTARLKGISIRDVTMLGGATGSIGIYFAGGSWEATARNCSIYNFTNCVKIQGGTSQAASLVWLERCDIQPAGVDNARGVLVVQTSNYPTSWTTGTYLVDCHMQGPLTGTGSYSLETDSCSIYCANTYFDLFDGHGIKISKNQTPPPFISASGVSFDSTPGTGASIESYANTRVFSDQIGGNFTVGGKWKLLDGTLLTTPTGTLRGNASLWVPHVIGGINLVKNGEADFMGIPYTNQTIQVDSGGNMKFTMPGTPIFLTGNGILQVDSPSAGSQAVLLLYDSAHANYVQLQGNNGSISLSPLSGGASRMMNSAGASMFEVKGTDGATFFLGAGLWANSALYLDSNRQLKSSLFSAEILHATANKAVDYTLTTNDYAIYVTATGHTMTLPAANTLPAGQAFRIKSASGVTTTIARSGSDTIEGATSDSLTALTAALYVSDGVSNYRKFPYGAGGGGSAPAGTMVSSGSWSAGDLAEALDSTGTNFVQRSSSGSGPVLRSSVGITTNLTAHGFAADSGGASITLNGSGVSQWFKAQDESIWVDYLPTNNTYVGIVLPVSTNTGGVNIWSVCFEDGSGLMTKAACNVDGAWRRLAMATGTALTGTIQNYLKQGWVRNDAWSWNPGQPLYLSSTIGDMTQTAPTTATNVVRVVGFAVTPTQIWFEPDNSYTVVGSGGGSGTAVTVNGGSSMAAADFDGNQFVQTGTKVSVKASAPLTNSVQKGLTSLTVGDRGAATAISVSGGNLTVSLTNHLTYTNTMSADFNLVLGDVGSVTDARVYLYETTDGTHSITWPNNAILTGYTNQPFAAAAMTIEIAIINGTTNITFSPQLIGLADVANNAIDNTKLAQMANHTVKARDTAGTGNPEDKSISAVLDWISSTRGTVLYRGASGWVALAPGTSGNVLQTQGAGADPIWASAGGGGGSSLTALFNTGAFVDVANTTTETALWTNSIAGGTLGTNKRIRVLLDGDCLSNNGTPTLTIKVYYGGTTLYADTIGTLALAGTRRAWRWEVDLEADNSATAQSMSGLFTMSSNNGATTGIGPMGSTADVAGRPIGGSSAENSANALGLGITATWNTASVNDSFRVRHATAVLYP